MSYINQALKGSAVLAVVAIIYKVATRTPGIISEPLESYDFIIVGGGSAGCVLASRLSEQFSVLVVEAGEQFGWVAKLPLGAPFIQGTENDWQYKTEPQQHSSYGLIDQVSPWPRGKGLGGSGQINYMVHYPGKRDDWEEMARKGMEGWSSTIMAHYMAKLRGKSYRKELLQAIPPTCSQSSNDLVASEDVCPSQLATDASSKPTFVSNMSRTVYTDKARIHVNKEDPRENYLLYALQGAAQELKHLRLTVSAGESTTRGGRRWSSLQSHLYPALSNGNLHVLPGKLVTKILFNGAHAQGIQIGEKAVAARKEVIVSAGVIGSPQLLQLSGVGPRELIQTFGIDVVADLDVGKNLHDQLYVPLYVSLREPVSLTVLKVLKVPQVFKYAVLGTGDLTRNAVDGIVTMGDVSVILFGMGSTEEKLFRVISNFKTSAFNSVFPHNQNHSAEGFVLLSSCLRPQSRGWVKIKSSDPSKPPRIQPNYLQDPKDIECTIQAVRLARRLLLTEPFERLGAKLHLPVLDECHQFEPSVTDKEYLECLIRTIAITSYHPAGTVPIGNSTHGVLDSAFRVKNVKGLRVVDASAIPAPLLGAPHSVLLSMAERAANLILAEAHMEA